jgi:O-antigen/teichoic acid export membrane protein
VQPLTWSASLAAAVFIPRFLSDAALGQWGIAYSIASLVAIVASFGLQSLLTRKVAIAPERASTLAWGAVAIVAASALPVAGILLFGISLLDQSAIDVSLTALAIGAALLATAQGAAQAVIIGLGRNAWFALSVAGTQILTTGMGLATLAFGGDVHAYAVAALVGWVIATGVLLGASGLRFTRAALAPSLLRELVVGGLPFFGWSAALRIRGGVDVIITGVLLQASVAGWLVAAYRILSVPVFIPTIITTPLLPALSRSRGHLDVYRRLLAESLATVILLTVPISASIFALAPGIPAFLGWRESLENAVPVMMVLAFQQPLVAIDMVLGVSLIALGLERPWFRVAVVGAIVNPALNFLTIPFAQLLLGNGAIGAAAVELTTECVFFAGALYLTPREVLSRDTLGRAARTVLAGVALATVGRLMLPHGLIVAFVAGGIAFVVAGLLLGILRPQQLRAVRFALRPA